VLLNISVHNTEKSEELIKYTCIFLAEKGDLSQDADETLIIYVVTDDNIK